MSSVLASPELPWHRRPGPRTVAASAAGAFLLSAFFFCPRYWLWDFAGAPLGDVIAIQPEFNRAFFVLQQREDPWQRVENLTHRVIEWRLFFPVLAHYLALPAKVLLGLPHLGGLAALAAAAAWLWRETRDGVFTAGGTVLVATASWFFVTTGWLAYFDGWLVLALVAACATRSHRQLLVAAAIAPWIDERFILAVPLCLGVRALMGIDEGRSLSAARWLAAGLLPYLVIRLVAELTQVRATSGSYWESHVPFAAPIGGVILGVWHGLRLGWIGVGFALAAGWRNRRWLAVAGIAVGLLGNLAAADDLSRSASVAVPVALAGLCLAWRAGVPRLKQLLVFLGGANLILPAAHVIATPRSSFEEYHREPLLYLYAEQERARHPPEFASPAAYTRRGMEALQADRLDLAAAQFDLALRLDPNFARARAHRGIVLYAQGAKVAGLAEIDRALLRAPELYDVRLQRASFRQEMGDLVGARADASEALKSMPADWPQRRAAEEFARRLGVAP